MPWAVILEKVVCSKIHNILIVIRCLQICILFSVELVQTFYRVQCLLNRFFNIFFNCKCWLKLWLIFKCFNPEPFTGLTWTNKAMLLYSIVRQLPFTHLSAHCYKLTFNLYICGRDGTEHSIYVERSWEINICSSLWASGSGQQNKTLTVKEMYAIAILRDLTCGTLSL